MSCNPERQAEYRAERGADSGVRGWVVVGGSGWCLFGARTFRTFCFATILGAPRVLYQKFNLTFPP